MGRSITSPKNEVKKIKTRPNGKLKLCILSKDHVWFALDLDTHCLMYGNTFLRKETPLSILNNSPFHDLIEREAQTVNF